MRLLPIALPLAALFACGLEKPSGPEHRARAGVRSVTKGPQLDVPRASAEPRPWPPPRVVVVGGGLAGLTAAYELTKRGIPTHLLEATDILGGRVGTAYYEGGLHAEYGLQEVWDGNPLLDIARELGVEIDGEAEAPFSSVVIDGELHPFIQDTAVEYFQSFLDADERNALDEWLAKARTLRGRAERDGPRDPELRHLQEISFAKWMEEDRLPHKVAELLRLTIECELAADWAEFSALIGLVEFRVFLEGSPAFHIRGGNIRVVQALAERVPNKTLSATVMRIDRERMLDGRIRARVYYMKDHQLRTIDAERVVVAVPFFRAHQIHFEPPLSDDKWRGVLMLNRGQYTVVHMMLSKQARPLLQIGGVSPFPVLTNGPLGVVYGVVEESPEENPVEIFSLLVYGAQAASFHMAPRERKMKQVLEELDKLWPGLSRHVRSSEVYTYHPASIAVWPPGRSPLDNYGRALRQPEMGVAFAGDWIWNGHSDGAVRSGREAALAMVRDLSTH